MASISRTTLLRLRALQAATVVATILCAKKVKHALSAGLD
jgi:hypothetical protein